MPVKITLVCTHCFKTEEFEWPVSYIVQPDAVRKEIDDRGWHLSVGCLFCDECGPAPLSHRAPGTSTPPRA